MFWVGLLLFVVVGGELGAVAQGATRLGDEDGGAIAQFVIGINLAPWTALGACALVYVGRRRRAGLEAKGKLSPALARIEDAQATGDGPDHRLELDLTVAPKGRPAYRVSGTTRVNVMHLQEFAAGRTLDVAYDPERPWRVEVPERCREEIRVPLDTAPESTRVHEPKVPLGGAGIAVLAAMAAGAAVFFLAWGS
ncbi:hypothetical protein HUT16_26370 [Kitasatospora sp. NA04385]|uniref:hypothetical protein n=1 Tax=Kitasatospora sp. NA04385 TaxID=2742135 RepID=UPI0015919F8F|nr:hypothetical protein [Kitasatospora sp. NA04385]QKW22125.1 hypothetical protein HUT16_26370 [Kitasatospora sp. NA04385]